MHRPLIEFSRWAGRAKPGDQFTYAIRHWPNWEDAKNEAFNFAMKLYERGDVFLCQRRNPDLGMEYVAIRCAPYTIHRLHTLINGARYAPHPTAAAGRDVGGDEQPGSEGSGATAERPPEEGLHDPVVFPGNAPVEAKLRRRPEAKAQRLAGSRAKSARYDRPPAAKTGGARSRKGRTEA